MESLKIWVHLAAYHVHVVHAYLQKWCTAHFEEEKPCEHAWAVIYSRLEARQCTEADLDRIRAWLSTHD